MPCVAPFRGTARCIVKLRRSEPKSWKRNELPMTLLTCQLASQTVNLFQYIGCDPLPVIKRQDVFQAHMHHANTYYFLSCIHSGSQSKGQRTLKQKAKPKTNPSFYTNTYQNMIVEMMICTYLYSIVIIYIYILHPINFRKPYSTCCHRHVNSIHQVLVSFVADSP